MRILVEVEVDDRLISDVLTDEWRNRFYSLETAGDVADHLAYNLVQGRALSGLDGFADQPPDRVDISSIEIEDPATEVVDYVPHAKEVDRG